MDLLDRAARVRLRLRRHLVSWYRRERRDLPWRRTRDPYRIWVSEVMLQQTRVETVVPYYERFLRAYPDVARLAAADEDRLMTLWEGLGYYARARSLLRAARVVAGEREGAFPETAAEWGRLPGIGPYTAGAIASIAFGERTPAVDGNVRRVLARLFALDGSPDDPALQRGTWDAARLLVPARAAGDWTQALMELGARVCVPRRPLCPGCPVRTCCEARAQGLEGLLPRRRDRKPVPHRVVACGAVRSGDRLLLVQRARRGLLAGLWELPGGPVPSGAGEREPAAALRRILRRDFGVRARVGPLLATVEHAYSHFTLTLLVYDCPYASGEPAPRGHDRAAWVPRSRWREYAVHAAARKALAAAGAVPESPVRGGPDVLE